MERNCTIRQSSEAISTNSRYRIAGGSAQSENDTVLITFTPPTEAQQEVDFSSYQSDEEEAQQVEKFGKLAPSLARKSGKTNILDDSFTDAWNARYILTSCIEMHDEINEQVAPLYVNLLDKVISSSLEGNIGQQNRIQSFLFDLYAHTERIGNQWMF
jgi:hypothetical protein